MKKVAFESAFSFQHMTNADKHMYTESLNKLDNQILIRALSAHRNVKNMTIFLFPCLNASLLLR